MPNLHCADYGVNTIKFQMKITVFWALSAIICLSEHNLGKKKKKKIPESFKRGFHIAAMSVKKTTNEQNPTNQTTTTTQKKNHLKARNQRMENISFSVNDINLVLFP